MRAAIHAGGTSRPRVLLTLAAVAKPGVLACTHPRLGKSTPVVTGTAHILTHLGSLTYIFKLFRPVRLRVFVQVLQFLGCAWQRPQPFRVLQPCRSCQNGTRPVSTTAHRPHRPYRPHRPHRPHPPYPHTLRTFAVSWHGGVATLARATITRESGSCVGELCRACSNILPTLHPAPVYVQTCTALAPQWTASGNDVARRGGILIGSWAMAYLFVWFQDRVFPLGHKVGTFAALVTESGA